MFLKGSASSTRHCAFEELLCNIMSEVDNPAEQLVNGGDDIVVLSDGSSDEVGPIWRAESTKSYDIDKVRFLTAKPNLAWRQRYCIPFA